jgi:hypothetical protein
MQMIAYRPIFVDDRPFAVGAGKSKRECRIGERRIGIVPVFDQ